MASVHTCRRVNVKASWVLQLMSLGHTPVNLSTDHTSSTASALPGARTTWQKLEMIVTSSTMQLV